MGSAISREIEVAEGEGRGEGRAVRHCAVALFTIVGLYKVVVTFRVRLKS